MKRYVGLVILLAIVMYGCTQQTTTQQQTMQDSNQLEVNPPAQQSAADIEIKGFAYTPSAITVKKGAIITWTNKDSAPHTVTSTSGSELNSNTLSKGAIYSHTFSTAGTFDYYCAIHPSMKAKVIVE